MRRLRRALLVLVVLAAVLYGGAIAWLMANETRLVFVAQPLGQLRPSAPFEEIAVPGESGLRQLIWVMRSPDASAARPWLFFLHGNASTVASRMNILHYERLRRLGFNVVTAEYRGYGGMEGVPTEAGIESDARAAFETVSERFQLDPRRVVVYGWSLGSAVAIDLAGHVQPAAVILEGAPASIMAIGQQRYPIFPVRQIMRNPFESILKIHSVTSPKLFLHSRDDELVPIEEGRRLFDAAPAPKQWVEVTGGHIYAAERDPAFFAHVESFLVEQRVLGREQTEALTVNGKQ
jgi:fermentation-respiration switch protein FrsA (DUF1100 family)